MSRQIRPLDLVAAAELLKLAMVAHDRRADVARLARLRAVGALRVVAWQGIAPSQMETPSSSPSAGRGAVV